jgi:hypothetical protein
MGKQIRRRTEADRGEPIQVGTNQGDDASALGGDEQPPCPDYVESEFQRQHSGVVIVEDNHPVAQPQPQRDDLGLATIEACSDNDVRDLDVLSPAGNPCRQTAAWRHFPLDRRRHKALGKDRTAAVEQPELAQRDQRAGVGDGTERGKNRSTTSISRAHSSSVMSI